MEPAVPVDGCSDQPADFKLDLGLLIVRIQKVAALTRPALGLLHYLRTLRRWEERNHCLVILMAVNFSCFIMPTAYNLVLALAVVAFCGSMGFMHRRSQCLIKVFPNANIKQDDFLGENGPVTHADVMRQYKAMLFDLDHVVERYIAHTSQVYSVLKWDNLEVSIRWYVAVTLVTLSLHLLPLRWTVTALINLFLLEHKAASVLRDSRMWSRLSGKTDTVDKSDCISVDSQDSPSTDLDPVTFGTLELSDSEGSDPERLDSSGPEEDSDDEGDDGNATNTKSASAKGGVVGKILEFKKKHQSATGNCVGCNVQFSTILKRRHVCSHCGNHFCSRCCSHKVPRSMFGATSPAAQTETVPVCGFCNMYLTGKKDPAMMDRDREKDRDKEKDKEKEKENKEKERDKEKDREGEKAGPKDQEKEKMS